MKHKLIKTVSRFFHDYTLNEMYMMNRYGPESRLTYRSLLYVDLIYGRPGYYTASSLADVLHISKPAVIMKVNELIRKGYLYRKQSETDKRVHYLYVNEETLPEYVFYDEMGKKVAQRMCEKYSPQEIETFCTMLSDLDELYAKEIKTHAIDKTGTEV